VVLDRYADSWFIADSSLRGYDGDRNVRDEEHSLEEKDAHEGKRTPWTLREFGGKTIWDWMGLLIVPIVLSLITVVFAWQQDARQQRIEDQRAEAERQLADQRAQDEALQAYLDQMGNLLLEKDLRNSEEDSEVRTLARARTLTVLGRLDWERNAAVLQFLREAKLIGEKDPVVRLDTSYLRGANLHLANLVDVDLSHTDLRDANLSSADLRHTDLRHADLRHADLSDAHLRHADLRHADLLYANLSDAHLLQADLSGADPGNANLSRADLRRADLSGTFPFRADLSGADLHYADLSEALMPEANLSNAFLNHANLSGADLSDVNLSEANLSEANLYRAGGITKEELEKQTSTLEGATMPDGQKYKD
jgi:uncharacterized protein YjbI with pentapeptide repeats